MYPVYVYIKKIAENSVIPIIELKNNNKSKLKAINKRKGHTKLVKHRKEGN